MHQFRRSDEASALPVMEVGQALDLGLEHGVEGWPSSRDVATIRSVGQQNFARGELHEHALRRPACGAADDERIAIESVGTLDHVAIVQADGLTQAVDGAAQLRHETPKAEVENACAVARSLQKGGVAPQGWAVETPFQFNDLGRAQWRVDAVQEGQRRHEWCRADPDTALEMLRRSV